MNKIKKKNRTEEHYTAYKKKSAVQKKSRNTKQEDFQIQEASFLARAIALSTAAHTRPCISGLLQRISAICEGCSDERIERSLWAATWSSSRDPVLVVPGSAVEGVSTFEDSGAGCWSESWFGCD